MRANLSEFWRRWETPIVGCIVVIVTVILTTTVLQARHTAQQYGPLRREIDRFTTNQVTNENQFHDLVTRELQRLAAENPTNTQLVQYAAPAPATTTTATTQGLTPTPPTTPGAPQPPTTIVVSTTVPPVTVPPPVPLLQRLLALLPPAPTSAPRCVVLTGDWCELYRRVMFAGR